MSRKGQVPATTTGSGSGGAGRCRRETSQKTMSSEEGRRGPKSSKQQRGPVKSGPRLINKTWKRGRTLEKAKAQAWEDRKRDP